MKWLIAVFFIFGAQLGWSADASVPTPPGRLKGEVLEVQQVASYTYLRLKTSDAEAWVAVASAAVETGATVSIENAELMDNFESKALNRTFAQIYFGSLVAAPATAAAQVATAHVGVAHQTDHGDDAAVPKASGPLAHTVAEIINQSAALKDQPVLLQARVVKYNAAVMGKNWIHVRDGSGAAADATNDLLITTQEQATVGDVIVFQGIVRKDRDFGSGYTYKVLIEDATRQN